MWQNFCTSVSLVTFYWQLTVLHLREKCTSEYYDVINLVNKSLFSYDNSAIFHVCSVAILPMRWISKLILLWRFLNYFTSSLNINNILDFLLLFLFSVQCILKRYMEAICLFKEYFKLLNRLYDITWFGSVYA